MPTLNHRLQITTGLYTNYLIHGAGILILAQSVTALAAKWHTGPSAVATVISAMGIGRLLVLLISGWLSDRLGRQLFVGLGMATYLAFFIGIVWSPTASWGFFFAFLAGCANSFLDAGTYPALMDIYPEHAGAANVLIKGAMSAGQFLLPLLVGLLITIHAWYGISFIVVGAILLLNAVFLLGPWWRNTNKPAIAVRQPSTPKQPSFHRMPWVLFLLLVIYGFLSQGVFWVFTQSIAQFGVQFFHLSPAISGSMLSWYSIGSFVCVLINVLVLSRHFTPFQLLVPFNVVGVAALIPFVLQVPAIFLFPAAFLVGFGFAGGVMQLGLTVMGETLPLGKGTATGFYYSAGAISQFVLPLITAQWSNHLITVMWFDFAIAVAGVIVTAAITILVRKEGQRTTRVAKIDSEN